MASVPAIVLECEIRIELCRLIAKRVPCVDRVASGMGIDRDALWARLDGRIPLTLVDISDICFFLDARPEITFEERA